jgi:hypothetical protein
MVENLCEDRSGSTEAMEAPGGPGDGVWSRTDRVLVARAALALAGSSTWLRWQGRIEEADRAAKWASWQRFAAENPGRVRPLFAAIADASACEGHQAFLDRALEGAISVVGADFGNIQLVDPVQGSLRIASQFGFGEDFLDHFAQVADDSSACGRAAHAHAQAVISDVRCDPLFAPHRKIAAASGFRAVESTPIVDRGRRLLGVVSTHFRRARQASGQELLLAEWYADRIGAALRARLDATPNGFPALSRGNHDRGVQFRTD